MSSIFQLAAVNNFSDLGRAQYHLEAIHDAYQMLRRYYENQVGHTVSDIEKQYLVWNLFSKMPKTINFGQDTAYLSAYLTKCSRVLNELRFDIYFRWSSFTSRPHTRTMRMVNGLRLDSEHEISLLLKIHWHIFVLDQLIRRNMIDLYHFGYVSSSHISITLPYEVIVINIDDFDSSDDEQLNTVTLLLKCPRWIQTRIEFDYAVAEYIRQMRIVRLLENAGRLYNEIERTLSTAFCAAVLNSESSTQFSYIHVGVDMALEFSSLLSFMNPNDARIQLQPFTFHSFIHDSEVSLTKLNASTLSLFFFSSSK
jgi:hypothetical protein